MKSELPCSVSITLDKNHSEEECEFKEGSKNLFDLPLQIDLGHSEYIKYYANFRIFRPF